MASSAPDAPAPSPSSAWRVVAVALVAGALTQLVQSASAADGAPGALGRVAPLERGNPIERPIRGGETHTYAVDVPPDHVAIGVVDQRGVDVMVRLVNPAGDVVATLDSPNGERGPEPWTLAGKVAGKWRIEVVPFAAPASEGRYEIRLSEVITAEEREERLATERYKSPRMLQLWRERRRSGAAAIDQFAKEMAGSAPLVEPIAGDERGDVYLTFALRGAPDTRYVGLIGGPASRFGEVPLLSFEGTDLFYLTVRSPKDARFTYSFRVGAPPNAGATDKERMASFAEVRPDPWNKAQSVGRSLVELPGAPPQPAIKRADGAPEGRVVEASIHSDILKEDRKLGVYLPPSFDPSKGPYPYVVVFDGEVYGLAPDAFVPTPVVLNNLIAEGKVPPMLAVLVHSQGTRNRDLPMSAPFSDFLATELAPWLRREYKASADPAKATLAGSSFGGLCAAYSAFHHPEVFGNALSQSGSFWYTPGALDVEAPDRLEPGAFIREVLAAPAAPVRYWMEVGRFEEVGGALSGANQLAQNRHMRDVLLAKSYRVSYHEYSGGHDYACWRGSLADGLTELAGAGAPPR